MKLYTRTGDDGTTGLVGGSRVRKDALRIEAIGAVDEANAALGLARAQCPDAALADELAELQAVLFELGADLATPLDSSAAGAIRLDARHVRAAEDAIDRHCQPLPAMRHFILPGGSESSARLHLARALCRRAERVTVALAAAEPVNPHALTYLNRLGDLLFAMARTANHRAGVPDTPWQAPHSHNGAAETR